MESLRQFEWHKDPNGYRLVYVAPRTRRIHFAKPHIEWEAKPEKDEGSARELSIKTTLYWGERRPPKSGLYIAGYRSYLNTRKGNASYVTVRPFENDDLVSLNLVSQSCSPQAWIDFSNRFGMLGTEKERWHLTGRDPKIFMYSVESEGAFHHLVNVLLRIYQYFPAIQSKNSDYLRRFIEWDSNDVVRETWGPRLGATQTRPAIVMKGYSDIEDEALNWIKKPDLVGPAAFSIQDHVNRYLRDALSLEIEFDQRERKFTPSLRYGSLGAALVAEAVEFMTGRFEAKQCKICSLWFRTGHEQKRRDRIFCSAACKMRDYRSRRIVCR
ncbi:hypothetical protein V1277_004493 [Bradyrhizobium sp. AZCC 1588]|uniref:hypothetical protein n=1 Tax=unclassified Bradyrhizobium TaxID=2631580 RepID=UPI002FF29BC7